MHFDPTVSIGNILTILGAGFALVLLWWKFVTSIAEVEANQGKAIDLLIQAVDSLKISAATLTAEVSKHEGRITQMEIATEVRRQVRLELEHLKGLKA